MNLNPIRKGAFILGGITALVMLLLGVFFWYTYELEKPVRTSQEPFRIEKGSALRDIAISLQHAHIIENAAIFILYGRLSGQDTKIQAGIYEIPPALSVKDLFGLFQKGNEVSISVLLREGLTLKESISVFRKQELAIDEEFFFSPSPSIKNPYAFLADMPENASLEGFLFPDTYEFSLNASSEEIAKTILRNFQKKFDPLWYDEIKKQGHSVYETIIMASILEKEVRTLEDKKLAAGLLWKRLELGMPLQVDSSVNYVTGKNLPAVTLDDLTVDSPYNTYKHAGLPPGPISNPGRESIEAAIFPEPSEYWFYLSRQDTGQTIFSRTLKEHNAAKAKYLR